MRHTEATTETILSNEERIIADLAGRKVLFIAYFFPPTVSTGVPGSQRTVKFLRNLSNGECHVLTVPATVSDQDNALRHLSLPINGEVIHRVAPWDIFKALLSLRKRVKSLFKRGSSPTGTSEAPAATQPAQSVFRSGNDTKDTRSAFQKLKDFIYDLCYFPDRAGPWILPATRYGKKLVREQDIDVIFATGSPWSGLITGYLISKATRKPLIVDFRDPWMDNPFHQSKGRFLDNWTSKLERKVVTHAAAVSLNTPPLRDAFIARYPEIEAERFFVMPNGFDPSEQICKTPRENAPPDTLVLCHTGFLYGVRDPAPLLEAIREANKGLGDSKKKVCLIQVGAINLSYDIGSRFEDLTQTKTLILKGKLSHEECIEIQAQADILVNIQPFTKTQVPSKLYEYLAPKIAIFNITPKDGALGKIVTEDGLGGLFENTDDNRLTATLIQLAIDKTQLDRYVPINIEKYRVDRITSVLSNKIIEISSRVQDA
ncbi:hypothetical protein DXI23_03690 [Marinobacter flavimaris]|uniref:Glycosyltransferase subfamily 4-like N-terminal domain-containing protein n=1 Tax=Marinobacter flavimaris TaxID=262076 RepID=A0A3D8H7T8_9GAMM|nr:glycosyltransferase [Marinobacter flavimaris]PPI79366.1 hypothetical protein MDHKLMBL_14475 [Marinobacter flavimaris]RDU42778.1 hypothetical protein DXI23_03690 [Marinobacter flavimaris]